VVEALTKLRAVIVDDALLLRIPPAKTERPEEYKEVVVAERLVLKRLLIVEVAELERIPPARLERLET
jgi:hypothetical protein